MTLLLLATIRLTVSRQVSDLVSRETLMACASRQAEEEEMM